MLVYKIGIKRKLHISEMFNINITYITKHLSQNH